jgi:hypothetical protein
MMRMIGMTVLFAAFVPAAAQARLVPVDNFSDILFWTGSGENESALVLQFPTAVESGTVTPATIAWGYRWSGGATLADMLFSLAGDIQGISAPPPSPPVPLLGADPRLTLSVGFFAGLGWFVDSLTYDQAGLGAGWSPESRLIAPYDFDTGEYAAQYQLDGAGGVWTTADFDLSGNGISSTDLVDGGWYGFVQGDGAGPFNFTQPVSAISAAVPEIDPGSFGAAAAFLLGSLSFLNRRLGRCARGTVAASSSGSGLA